MPASATSISTSITTPNGEGATSAVLAGPRRKTSTGICGHITEKWLGNEVYPKKRIDV